MHSIIDLLSHKTTMHSLTDFMWTAINSIPGEIVGTEVSLTNGELFGRIDVLRKTKDGFIIQEEKTSDPPSGDGVWPSDLLQVDAYALLVESSNEKIPVAGGIILYSDLVPRKVRPDPKRASRILQEIMKLLNQDELPKSETNTKKCVSCAYYPLCQVLPLEGRIGVADIRNTLSAQLDMGRTVAAT